MCPKGVSVNSLNRVSIEDLMQLLSDATEMWRDVGEGKTPNKALLDLRTLVFALHELAGYRWKQVKPTYGTEHEGFDPDEPANPKGER